VATRALRAEKPVARLWVFAPPHRLLGGTARLSESTVVGYVARAASGELQWGEASVALLPRCQRVEIVFDGGDVFQTAVAAPRLSEAKLRLALPNLLEDRLLADPTQCHVAFLPAGRGADRKAGDAAELPVAAIDRGLLTRVLDVMTAAGTRPRAAYSAIYVLPPPGNGALPAFVARGRLVARTAEHDGIACDIDDGTEPPAALRLALRSGGWQRIRAFGPQAPRLVALAEALGVTVEPDGRPLEADAPDGSINLLQGGFARGGVFSDVSRLRLSLQSWKAPLVWSAVALAVFIAGMNGYWLKLQSEAGELRNRMSTAFRSTFADAEMVDPIVQAQRELVRLRARAGQSSASDFTALNAQVAQLLAAAPVGIVAGIEYRDAALQLKFKSPPDAQLQNQLRTQAVQQGLQLRFEADGAARVSAAGG
jgi:general secretion pathway protein L